MKKKAPIRITQIEFLVWHYQIIIVGIILAAGIVGGFILGVISNLGKIVYISPFK